MQGPPFYAPPDLGALSVLAPPYHAPPDWCLLSVWTPPHYVVTGGLACRNAMVTWCRWLCRCFRPWCAGDSLLPRHLGR
jgi:hypothetical protein